MSYDRDTALAILKEFSRDMYPSYDLFGNKTLVINRDKFEAIRAKYLDQKEQNIHHSLVAVIRDRYGANTVPFMIEEPIGGIHK